jgi:acyl carrier protein
VWRGILGVPEVGADENFFDLGGDSLKAIQMTMAARQELSLSIPVLLIIENPEFAGYCAEVARLA